MIESYMCIHIHSFIHSFIWLIFALALITSFKIELVCIVQFEKFNFGRVIMFDEMEIMRHGERTNIVFFKREGRTIGSKNKQKFEGPYQRAKPCRKYFCFKNKNYDGHCLVPIFGHEK